MIWSLLCIVALVATSIVLTRKKERDRFKSEGGEVVAMVFIGLFSLLFGLLFGARYPKHVVGDTEIHVSPTPAARSSSKADLPPVKATEPAGAVDDYNTQR